MALSKFDFGAVLDKRSGPMDNKSASLIKANNLTFVVELITGFTSDPS